MIDENKVKELDSHWNEVMDLAVKYGFICVAYGGTAMLSTHKNQIESLGEEKYLKMRNSDVYRHE